MSAENGKRYPTWPWLAGVLLLIVMGLTGNWASDVKGEIKELKQDRVTRAEFNQMRNDVNRILELLLSERPSHRPSDPGPR